MILTPGTYYEIKHTGEFCHCVGSKGFKEFSKGMNDGDQVTVQFVGTVKTKLGMRNVFFDENSNSRKYYMFDADNAHTYVIR